MRDTPKPNEAIPRSRILRGGAVFSALRKAGRRANSKSLTLMMIDWPQGTGEAAFATPKKLGQAATRNLLRRRMREAYRRFVPAPPAGTVILWMAKAPALALSFDELRNDMLILARRSYAR